MASEIILVLGGARAGKSAFAERLAAERAGGAEDGAVTFIATAEALDEEMRERIERHRAERPAGWITLEAPRDLARAVREVAGAATVVVDCLTLWVSNVLLELAERGERLRGGESIVGERMEEVVRLMGQGSARWIVVSNEVGLGLVPETELGRVYRDALGRANQIVAAAAQRVYLLVAGVPVVVKG
jgi:adenosylcobinamide kinase/adenosylcobinamide-phosphate guanylyltransferase